MNEVVHWGSLRLTPLEFECEFADSLPDDVRRFIQTAHVNFVGAFKNIVPGDRLEKALQDEKSIAAKIGKDTGLIGGLVAELSALSISYAKHLGAPCLLFYWGTIILEKLTQLLTALGLFKESSSIGKLKSDIEKINNLPDVDFNAAILEKSKSLAPRDIGNHKSFYPFFVFPLLANSDYESGQGTSDLERDILVYEGKLQKIRNIRTDNAESAIKKISRIIDTPISASSSDISSTEEVEKIKKSCIVAMATAYAEASKSFEHIPAYNAILTQSANRIF